MRNKYILREDTKTVTRIGESLLEVLILTVLYYGVWRFCYEGENFPPYFGNGKYVLMGVYGLLTYILMQNTDGFQFGNLRRMDLALAQWIALMLVNCITYLQLSLIANKLISVLPIVLLMVAQIPLTAALITLYAAIYHKLYAPHDMIMVYGNRSAVVLKIKMDRREDKYHINQLISVSEGYEKICQEIVKHQAVVLNDVPAEIRNDLLKFCYEHKIRTYVVPKISDLLMRGATDITVFDTPMVLVKGTGLSLANRFFKRAMDIIICLIVMVVAAPIMLVVAAAIKLEDGGPVFYTQKRATRDGKEFDILKFRSMIVDAEKEGLSIPATGADPRITKVGRIIRATRIDELPQILNILKGDMSVVGPRPERLEHIQKYSEEIPEFAYRLKVKGGLTGYAQIYGKYNTSAYDKLRLDLMYIENFSLLMDIKLILMTVRIMLSKDSTEGFDKAEELERLVQKSLDEESTQTEEPTPAR